MFMLRDRLKKWKKIKKKKIGDWKIGNIGIYAYIGERRNNHNNININELKKKSRKKKKTKTNQNQIKSNENEMFFYDTRKRLKCH